MDMSTSKSTGKPVRSAAERAILEKTINARFQVAADDIKALAADQMARAEAELSQEFDAQDDLWKDLTAMASQAAKQADAELARRCEAAGIRPNFRPSIQANFYDRGENASSWRRAELRKLAHARVEANMKKALAELRRRRAAALETLVLGGLDSDEARAFLASMPTAADLLPAQSLVQMDVLSATTPRNLKLIERTGTDDTGTDDD
jgi:hypothetical protein